VHWPLRGKENTGRAPEALVEYASTLDRAAALRDNQARPGEWGFFATADKRQPDDKRRKARPRLPRDPLADCEVREPTPADYDCYDQSGAGACYWDGFDQGEGCFDAQAMQMPMDQGRLQIPMDACYIQDPSPLNGSISPSFPIPSNVQLNEGVHMPHQPQFVDQHSQDFGLCPSRDYSMCQSRDYPMFEDERAEPRPEPRRSPIIVVDSAGQQQEMWSFTATHGPPGYGTWSSEIEPRFGPAAEFREEEEAFLLDQPRLAALTIDCLNDGDGDEIFQPMPTPTPMKTPTRFGFVHFAQDHDCEPVARRRSRSQPPVSMAYDFDAPLPSPVEEGDEDEALPETPPRPHGRDVSETPLPMSAKKRRGGRGRHGKAKAE